jgi:phosphoglycolate phosphatase-like HAD superfamily hydrolase
MNLAGRRMFGERFDLGDDLHGQLDGLLFREAMVRLGIDDHAQHHDGFIDSYSRKLQADLAASGEQIRIMPGVVDLILELDERDDIAQGVVTGNYRRAAELKLQSIGFDPMVFTTGAFGEEADDRPGLVNLAIERFEARLGRQFPRQQVIVIGDTPRDIECAKANGCCSFAVATGHHSVEDLRSLGADYVVQDLEDSGVLRGLLG